MNSEPVVPLLRAEAAEDGYTLARDTLGGEELTQVAQDGT